MTWGTESHGMRAPGEPSLEERLLADTSHDDALIMFVNPYSLWPIALQKAFLWIKRHVFRQTLR